MDNEWGQSGDQVGVMAAKSTAFEKRVLKALDRQAYEIRGGGFLEELGEFVVPFEEMFKSRGLDPLDPEHLLAMAMTLWAAVFMPGSSGQEPKWNPFKFQRDYWVVRELSGVETAEEAYKIMRTLRPWSDKYGQLEQKSFRKTMAEFRKVDDGGMDWPAFCQALKEAVVNDRRRGAAHLSEDEWNRKCRDKFLAAKEFLDQHLLYSHLPILGQRPKHPETQPKSKRKATRRVSR
jgi:hypothetical protein